MCKKITSLLLALVMCLGLCVPAFAASNEILNREEMDTILLELGFTAATVKAVSDDEAAEIVRAYLDDPEAVTVSSTVMNVDVVKEVEEFVNTPYDELIDMGFSVEEISRTSALLDDYYAMSDEDLAEELNLTEYQAQFLKEVIEPNPEYEVNSRAARSTIPQSELNFTMVATNRSTSTQMQYAVNVFFAWQKTYSIVGFDDVVGVAWGAIAQ